MKPIIAALTAVFLASAAHAVEPVGSSTFNTKPDFELSTLTSANFYDVLVPLAKQQGTVTFFDFTDSFGPLFSEHLIPEFEAKYGLKVEYIRGNSEAAVQQLLAAHKAGAKAPADAYFVSSGNLRLLRDAGVVANVPLNKLLPNGAALDGTIATVTGGIDHGGTYLPFHRNQTSIVYDTRQVPTDQVPTDLAGLLAFAKANPGKFIVTSPAGGGSGSGFVQSIALAKVTDEACRAKLTDYAITPDEAKAYAAGPCMTPAWDYYKQILDVAEITKGNSDTLNLLANGAGSVGTAWEDMAYDFLGRGLLPPTIRQEILAEGQVGGGDGMFLPVDAEHSAAALLLLDFMISKDVQLEKLQLNGSRSARTDIDPKATFTAEQVDRLIPTDQFQSRAKVGISSTLNSAFSNYVVANLLKK